MRKAESYAKQTIRGKLEESFLGSMGLMLYDAYEEEKELKLEQLEEEKELAQEALDKEPQNIDEITDAYIELSKAIIDGNPELAKNWTEAIDQMAAAAGLVDDSLLDSADAIDNLLNRKYKKLSEDIDNSEEVTVKRQTKNRQGQLAVDEEGKPIYEETQVKGNSATRSEAKSLLNEKQAEESKNLNSKIIDKNFEQGSLYGSMNKKGKPSLIDNDIGFQDDDIFGTPGAFAPPRTAADMSASMQRIRSSAEAFHGGAGGFGFSTGVESAPSAPSTGEGKLLVELIPNQFQIIHTELSAISEAINSQTDFFKNEDAESEYGNTSSSANNIGEITETGEELAGAGEAVEGVGAAVEGAGLLAGLGEVLLALVIAIGIIAVATTLTALFTGMSWWNLSDIQENTEDLPDQLDDILDAVEDSSDGGGSGGFFSNLFGNKESKEDKQKQAVKDGVVEGLQESNNAPMSETHSSTKHLVAGEEVVAGKPLSAKQRSIVELSRSMGNPTSPDVQAAYDLGPSSELNGVSGTGETQNAKALSGSRDEVETADEKAKRTGVRESVDLGNNGVQSNSSTVVNNTTNVAGGLAGKSSAKVPTSW